MLVRAKQAKFSSSKNSTITTALPNSLTIENIKFVNAVVRNNLVVSFSSKIMKYRGLGSGARRAIKEEPSLQLIDDKDGDRFIVKIPRKGV